MRLVFLSVIVASSLALGSSSLAAECKNLNGDIVSKKISDGKFLIASAYNISKIRGVLADPSLKLSMRAQIGYDIWVKEAGTETVKLTDPNGFDQQLTVPAFKLAPECKKEIAASKIPDANERKKNATSCPGGSKFISNDNGMWAEEFCEVEVTNEDGGVETVKHGLFTNWRSGGRKSVQGNYDHGKKIGIWREWDTAHSAIPTLESETNYQGPDIKKEFKWYWPSGKLHQHTDFTEEGKMKLNITYNKQGKKAREENGLTGENHVYED